MRASSALVIGTVLLSALLAVVSPAPGVDGPEEKAKEFERIKREMQEKKKEINRVKKKERSVLADLDKIDRDIQSGSLELVSQQKRLNDAETDLRGVEESIDEIGRELTGIKILYGQRLRELYKVHRSGRFEVPAPGSMNTVVKQVKYLTVIARRDQSIIDEFGTALRRLSEQGAKIEDIKKELLASRRNVEAKRTELEVKRQKKSIILASVRREKSLYEQTLNELEEASVSLWTMIKRDEKARRSSDAPSASVKHHPAASSENKGLFPWPLEGPVLTRFGMQRHPQFGTMVFRRGIEIEAREGQPVSAVESGQVAYADWYKGYGKLMILDHGNGFYTLYGNLSRLDRAKGEHVAKGQVIGLAGETGSFKGSKLYFEIRRNGEAQDPLAWLSRK